jgi:regulator of cell morphogenesis and NO signaling
MPSSHSPLSPSSGCPTCLGYVAELRHAEAHATPPPSHRAAATSLDPATRLGDLARQRPEAIPLLERLQLDYCCGGGDTLAEACERRGLDAHTVAALIDAVDEEPSRAADPHDVRRASIAELCDHIVAAHHALVRTDIPRIAKLLDTVVRVHGKQHAELHDLRRVFASMSTEIEEHIDFEEATVFPACRALEAGEEHERLDDALLAMCEDAHDDAGQELAALRELSGGYSQERPFCNTHRALLDALHGFELDMHQHVHEENNVLFPRARKLASAI